MWSDAFLRLELHIILSCLLLITQDFECLPMKDTSNSSNSQHPHVNQSGGTSLVGQPSLQVAVRKSQQIGTDCNKTRALPASETTQGRDVRSQCSALTGLAKPNPREISTRQGKSKKEDPSRESFREETENYPEDEIKQMLRQTPNELKELYNVLNTPLDPNVNLTERVAHHYSDDDTYEQSVREESICRSVVRNIYPREATRDNAVVYVANTQDFMQVIQAEYCRDPEGECNYLRDNLPYGMQSVCVQKYAYKKLLFLNQLEKRMSSDLFRYPSCCSCHVRTLSLDLRSGLNNSIAKKISNEKHLQNSTSIKPSPVGEDIDRQDTSQSSLREPKLIDRSTILISDSASGQGECNIKCKGTAVSGSSSNNTLSQNQAPKPEVVVGGELEKKVERPQDHSNRSQIVSSPVRRHFSNQTNHTIVLQEDKVYTPNKR